MRRLTQTGAERIVAFSRDEVRRGRMLAEFGWHPGVRVAAGDVRDVERLPDLFAGCETIVHAAARKVVSAYPDEPAEMLKTNIVGTMNVIAAAHAVGVRKLLFISSDKACLDYHAPVSMSGGRDIPIHKLVGARTKCRVQSLSEHGVVDREVTGWHKNPINERRMVGVSYEDGRKWGKGVSRAWMTEDHPVLTTAGWVRADALTESHLLVTGERAPDYPTLSAIVGWVLGDAHITRKGSLRISQCAQQRHWVEIKHEVLSAFGPTKISVCPRRSKHQDQHSFALSGHGFCRYLRREFYPSGKKIVPRRLIEYAFSPEMLAAWYLDDGGLADRRCGGRYARLATHGFLRDDVEWLAKLLVAHGIEAKAYDQVVDGKTYVGTVLTSAGTYRLFEIIGRYVPPSLKYKAPSWAPPYDPRSWERCGGTVPFTARPIVTRTELQDSKRDTKSVTLPGENKGKQRCIRGHQLTPDNVRVTSAGGRQCRACIREHARKRRRSGIRGRRDVYCIDVEGTHNFIVNGVVVHNCHAENAYGTSKAMTEHLVVGENARTWPHGLRMAVLRYGNVLASTGSVLTVWRRCATKGTPFPLSSREMTRFWLTLPQAVDAIIAALADLRGGEVFVPYLPAAPIVRLAEALVDGDPMFDEQGIRPGGEKLHESLLSASEIRRARRRNQFFIVPPYQHEHMWDNRPWLGELIPPATIYRSDVWPWQLTRDEMRRLIETADYDEESHT